MELGRIRGSWGGLEGVGRIKGIRGGLDGVGED